MAILNLGCRARRWQELSFEQIRGCLLRCRQETEFCGERIDLPAWKKGWLTCITMLQKELGSPAILLDDLPRGIIPLRSRHVCEQHMIEIVDFPKGVTTSHTPSNRSSTLATALEPSPGRLRSVAALLISTVPTTPLSFHSLPKNHKGEQLHERCKFLPTVNAPIMSPAGWYCPAS